MGVKGFKKLERVCFGSQGEGEGKGQVVVYAVCLVESQSLLFLCWNHLDLCFVSRDPAR